MNKTFDWNRFCKVVNKDFHNIWQNYGMTMLIFTLLPLAAWLLVWALGGLGPGDNNIPASVRLVFIMSIVSFVCIMAPSRMYRTCNLPKEGIYFAMLPASKLEKYLSMILFCIVVCPLICLCGSLVLDMFLTLLPFGPYEDWFWESSFMSLFGPYPNEYMNPNAHMDDESVILANQVLYNGRFILMCIPSLIASGAMFLFTGTIFKKHKVLKTFLALWGIEFVLQIILIPFIPIFINWIDWDGPKDVEQFISWVYWGSFAINVVLAGVLLWWTGRRLKKMRY